MKHVSKSLITVIIAGISFLILAFFVRDIPHTGQSAYILSQKLGVDPFPSFLNPVYGWLVKAVAAVGGSYTIYLTNLLSAVFAAGILGFVFAFIYRSTRTFNVDNSMPAGRMHQVQIGAGLMGVLFLLASPPFWMAATRANPITFDLLLLLVSLYLAISHTDKSGPARIYLATLLYGISVVEFNTSILIAPFFIILVLIRLWSTGMLTARILLKVAGCGVLGLSLYVLQAGLFITTPAFAWREFRDIYQVIWYIWLEQYQTLTGGLPRVGWLTLALVSFVPWVITSLIRIPGGPNRARGALFGTSLLNLILAVLAIMALADSPLSPAKITGTTRLFVTPYLLIALWLGNVMAFGLVTLFRNKRFERPWQTATRRVLGVVISVIAPAILGYFFFTRSVVTTRDPVDALVQEFVSQLVDEAADREWLVSNTPFDDQVSLEIWRRKLPIKTIRISYGRSSAMMRYVAHLFADQPRLESLARIGMEPLMDQWFLLESDADQKIAVVTLPDLWLAAGLESVPRTTLFLGSQANEDVPVEELLTRARAFWSDYGRRLIAADQDTTAPVLLNWIRVHLSKMANNLGVLLEDHDRADAAMECYQQARAFAPDNLSALMNQHVLAQKLNLPEFEAIEKELEAMTANLDGKVQSISLAYVYGYVRVPEVFVNRGLNFAMTGRANMAIRDMKRALAMRQGNPQLELAIASLYFGQGKNIESAEYYEQVLSSQPGNLTALVGLLRLAAQQRDFDKARSFLPRLKDAGASPSAIKFEEAMIDAISGDSSTSLKLLQQVVKEKPDNLSAWAAIAAIAVSARETDLAEAAMKKLREAKVMAPGIELLMAQTALNQNDRDGARRHINEVLRRQPTQVQALELLLRLHVAEANRDDAQRVVERILSVEPGNALANYMLGVHHYYNEEYVLAESAYRASIATRPSGEAHNDLAYVLYLQKKFEEAEGHARKALAFNDRNSAAWDTLGLILMNKDILPEAEKALLQSLSIRPDTATVLLSLAILYEKQGRLDEANQQARVVCARLNQLPPDAQIKLRELNKRLDAQR